MGWLDTPHDEEWVSAAEDIHTIPTPVFIPLIEWSQITVWLEPDNHYPSVQPRLFIPVQTGVSRKSFALRMPNDVMEAPSSLSIPCNAILIVDPEYKINSGSLLIVSIDHSTEPTCRQLIINGRDHRLNPLNTNYPIDEGMQYTSYGVVRQVLVEL